MSDMYGEPPSVLEIKKEPLTREVLRRSIILIAVSAVIGVLLIWLLSLGELMTIVAYIAYLFQVLIGLMAGAICYYLIKEPIPEWVRFTVAAIVVVTLVIGTTEVLRSHKFVREYQYVLDRED